MGRKPMARAPGLALGLLASLTLAACGAVTGPPASGANSSAPEAVQQAHGGDPGGGSNAFNRALPVVQ